MKYLFLILTTMIISSCLNKSEPNLNGLKQQMLNTDRIMSAKATEIGFNQALMLYAAEDFVKFSDGQHPIIGLEAFKKVAELKEPVKSISWEPVKAEIASSGDFGFTWGNWKYNGTDTVLYGNYFTVWKKMENGEWKMLADGGNSTPKPQNGK